MNARPGSGPADVDAVAHVFVDALDDRCEITGADGHHLQRVRRLTHGELVTAADGSGAWRTYEVTDTSSGALALLARTEVQIEPRPFIEISLAVALTKAGLDDVVAAVTELGVARVLPVRTARAVVRWDDAREARAVARLRTVARESAMQSRRARITVIDDLVGLKDLVGRPGLLVADHGGIAPWVLEGLPEHGWTVLVGPEGGLTPEELSWLGEVPRIALGRHILRAATAPVAAAAVLSVQAARLGPE